MYSPSHVKAVTQHQNLLTEGREHPRPAIKWQTETLTCQKKSKYLHPNEADSASDSPLGGYT